MATATPKRWSAETFSRRGIDREPPHDRSATWLPARSSRVNVGQSERMASLVGGGALAVYGLSKGSMSGLALAALGGCLAYRGWTGHCDMYETLGMSSAHHKSRTSIPAGQGIKLEEAVTIMRPAEELYNFWRNFENLPQVMSHLVAVEDLGNGRSHWVAEGPTGNVQWDAEIINERRNELIAWRSLAGSDVDTSGSVHFTKAPGDRGTEVHVVLSYNPPAGRIGATLAWLAGEAPEQQVREDLRNFKRKMETGVGAENYAHA